MDRTVLKLKINLTSITSISVATTLWNHEEIKPKIREYFEDAKINDRKSPIHPPWQKIVKKVSDHVNLLDLPDDIKASLQDIIILIGEKIFYWNMYVLRNLDLLHEYTYKIYWTQFGTVDESKIFKYYWAPISEEGLTRLFMRNNDLDIYFLACLFYQKSYLKEHYKNMVLQTTLFLAPVTIPSKCSIHTLIIIWLCAYFTTNKESALEMYRELKNSDTTNIDLFFICVDNAFFHAVKYFWRKLSQEEKEKVVVKGAEKCLANFDKVEVYEEKSIEIFIFLINNMSADTRNKFISENIKNVFRLFLNSWPFQDMFVQIIEEFANDIELGQVSYLLSFTASCILDGLKTERYVNKNVWRKILPIVFRKLDRDNKISLVTSTTAFPLAIFDKFDISMLTLILNDEDLADYKEELLNLGIPKFKKLIKARNFSLINTLLQNVLPKPKRKEFKLKIDVIPELICEEEYELADEVLDWLTDSEEEKIQIKKQIDPVKVFPNLKNLKLELDRLFSWKNATEEEKKKAEQAIKDQKFICDKIIKLWNEKGENGKLNSFEFLKSIFKTPEEEIEFKKNLIIDENFIKKFCDALPNAASFKRIDELLQFLSLTPEKVLELKEKIIENIDKWINTYTINRKNFYLADAIVNWALKSKTQKTDVMGKFINSSDGAKFLLEVVATYARVDNNSILALLNSWVRLYGNVKKIQKELDSIKHNNLPELWSKVCLGNWLDELAQKGRVGGAVINRWLLMK